METMPLSLPSEWIAPFWVLISRGQLLLGCHRKHEQCEAKELRRISASLAQVSPSGGLSIFETGG